MELYNFIQRSWKTLRTAAKTLLDLNRTFESLVARIQQGPSLPCNDPTKPYWLEDPPFPELVDIQSPQLPSQADIVIVGSGITGVAVARSLLQESKRKGRNITIAVLEARTICSGATGRNGGHIKVSPHATFEALERRFGTERAIALTRFQLEHLRCLTDLCKAEGHVEAECRTVETVDLFLDHKTFEKSCQTVSRLRTLLPECRIETYEANDARKNFEVSDHVVGALSYKAGALWPYRLITAVWHRLLQEFPQHITMETNTSVVSIDKEQTADHPYNVYTNRGVIRCNHVVHATNAWMSHLLPTLKSKSTGARAHMSAQNPGYHIYNGLHGNRSWSIVYGDNDFDYMTQRPSSTGMSDIMFGGGFSRSMDNGLNQIAIWDDSRTDIFTSAHLTGILPMVFTRNAQLPEHQAHTAFLQQHWSGIISLTGDSLPFVGRVEDRLTGRQSRRGSGDGSSEWISAGYNGEGMVFAWLCGTALGIMIMGTDQDDIPASDGFPGGVLSDWFPKELLLDSKRYDRIDVLDLADHL